MFFYVTNGVKKNSCTDSLEPESLRISATKSPRWRILTAQILKLDGDQKGYLAIVGLFGYQIRENLCLFLCKSVGNFFLKTIESLFVPSSFCS
ncbi:hypothetical protein Aconfl_09480 [Algoriphagus confluentis]|uniref:Uncharacterized protein n=1 Tax=Algoriphagus confluentis TaxID=1697556 RepID=A0ABQ6PM57_9BACT|nr:hypothetical protein Aconfl_09480 [Algoriphagus confluentis]